MSRRHPLPTAALSSHRISLTPPKSPAVRLLAFLVVLAVCWLVLLPTVARMPAVGRMVQRNERLAIDPSAKFYSELAAMPGIRRHMREVRAGGGEAFWRPVESR